MWAAKSLDGCSRLPNHALVDLLFTETTAFGLRRETILRLKLARRFETVETPYGPITVKLGLKGDRILQFAPEFETSASFDFL
jgi:uncharacterized protein (DUF111 family)